MCLILASTAAKVRTVLLTTPGLLRDIYSSNPDGIGAMYITSKGKLRTPKVLPRTVEEAFAFIRQLPGDDRNLALHFRWKTHGAIDMENCHPYPIVQGQVHFMHNGVLAHGNKDDKSKSDTWHYAKNVLTPQLSLSPDLFKVPSWIDFIETDIGRGNRFVFMDNTGEMVIANKDTGIEHDGVWFANTYAWSPELLIPGYKPKGVTMGYGRWLGHGRDWDEDDNSFSYSTTTDTPARQSASVFHSDGYIARVQERIDEAFENADVEALAEVIKDFPLTSFTVMFDHYAFIAETGVVMGGPEQHIVTLLEAADAAELTKLARSSDDACTEIADVATFLGYWYSTDYEDDKTVDGRPVVSSTPPPVSDNVVVMPARDAKWSANTQPIIVSGPTEAEAVGTLAEKSSENYAG